MSAFPSAASPWNTSPSNAHRDPSGQAWRPVFPVLRYLAGFDRLLLLLAIALLGCLNDCRIDDLPTLGQIPGRERLLSKRANRLSMVPARMRLSRNSQIVLASGTLSERPSPRNHINESRPWMTHSAWSSEIIECLEHQDLERQHRRKRRTPAFRSIRSLQRLGQWLLEHGPRDDRVQLLERIAHSAQPLVALSRS